MNSNFSKIVYLMFLFALPNFAQNFQMQSFPREQTILGLRMMRPIYSGGEELSTFSADYDLYTNIPVTSKGNLVVAIPFGSYSNNISKNSYLGNIFIAYQIHNLLSKNYTSAFTAGLYLPTLSSDYFIESGYFTNFYESNKYIENNISVYLNYSYMHVVNKTFSFGLEVGPDIRFNSKNTFSDDVDFYTHFAARLNFAINYMTFSSEFNGIVQLNGTSNISDRIFNNLVFGAQWTKSVFNPKVYYNKMLTDSFSKLLDGVLGVGFEFVF